MIETIKHLLVGNPFSTSQNIGQRLAIPLALVIVAANALSSVAYASEEILLALHAEGEFSSNALVLITLAVIVLMFLVVLTYDYVIRAYPGGGGAYVVSKENLGAWPSLVAAGSLLVEYTLTVAVSITAGTAALVSAFPQLEPYRILLALALIAVLTLINLRGVQQSAKILAPPVYLFIGSLLLTIGVGIYRYLVDGAPAPTPLDSAPLGPNPALTLLGSLVLLRAFASGCVALTGIEAVSNATAIFRPPGSEKRPHHVIDPGLAAGNDVPGHQPFNPPVRYHALSRRDPRFASGPSGFRQ